MGEQKPKSPFSGTWPPANVTKSQSRCSSEWDAERKRISALFLCAICYHTRGLLKVAVFKKSLSCHLEESCVTFLWPVHHVSGGRCQSLLHSLKSSSRQMSIFLTVVSLQTCIRLPALMPRNLIYLSSLCWRRRTDILKANSRGD